SPRPAQRFQEPGFIPYPLPRHVKKMMLLAFSLLFYEGVLCDPVTQSSPDQTVTSGSKVTLLCTYKTSHSNPDLYWYRMRPDHSFQFILYRDNTASLDAEFTRGRFSVQHSQTQKNFHLVISSVEIEDSATYYCALRSTVMQVPGSLHTNPCVPGPSLRQLPLGAAHVREHGVLLPSNLLFQPGPTSSEHLDVIQDCPKPIDPECCGRLSLRRKELRRHSVSLQMAVAEAVAGERCSSTCNLMTVHVGAEETTTLGSRALLSEWVRLGNPVALLGWERWSVSASLGTSPCRGRSHAGDSAALGTLLLSCCNISSRKPRAGSPRQEPAGLGRRKLRCDLQAQRGFCLTAHGAYSPPAVVRYESNQRQVTRNAL
ncbi:hypothetical protein MC885_020687, partial [Smutsia gigantea]